MTTSGTTTPKTPETPEPDAKDWTWVLDQPCPDCGFDARDVTDGADLADRIRAATGAMQAALERPDATTRPRPQVWSPLEYAAHVRDVCIVFGTRLVAMRSHDDPMFANWDQDATALAARYWEADPRVVAGEVATEGDRIAAAFASVRSDEWSRPGRRSNGSVFTIDTLGRYFLHDLVHHVHDVQSGPAN